MWSIIHNNYVLCLNHNLYVSCNIPICLLESFYFVASELFTGDMSKRQSFTSRVVVPYCYLFLLSVFILWFIYYVSDIF